VLRHIWQLFAERLIMARRYFVYSSVIGVVSLVIMTRLAMLGSHMLQELPLLVLIVILMIVILAIQFNLSKPSEQLDTNRLPSAFRSLGSIVILAFLCITVAYCAGVLSRGNIH
jgi:magnesium-transporting ATPase (P-type)